VLIEAARDEEGAKWYPLGIYPREVTSCDIIARPTTYPGLLKFRAIPIVLPAAR
jgi:hypothetical protein